MTAEIALLLAILALALALFWWDAVAADVVGLGVLLALVLTGLLAPGEAFAGFGSDTAMLILGLLLLTATLVRTGVVELAGRAVQRVTGGSARLAVVVMMLAAAGFSAFMSNTAATAFFLPIALGVARRTGTSPSRILMPLAFASVLASSLTLVATSTNIVVSGLMQQSGLEPIGMFELSPVGLAILGTGLVYMLLVGNRLIPDRFGSGDELQFGLRPYLSEVVILSGSRLVGRTLAQSNLGRDLDLTVLRVVRGDARFSPAAELVLREGDILLVEGERDNVLKVKDEVGIEIRADLAAEDPLVAGDGVKLVEAIVLQRSPLVHETLSALRFRERFGLQVLAIHRHGATLHRRLHRERLEPGDLLLLQGPPLNLRLAEDDGLFRVLVPVEGGRPNFAKAKLAAALFAGAIALATFEIVALPVAVLLAAALAFATRCIAPEEAYRDVEWRAIVLIASMLALGRAMETTGTAAYLAGRIVEVAGGIGVTPLLAGFFALTVLLTQPMSNQAAAAVVVPIAIQSALALGLDPRPFAILVAVAASCSYLTPLEPSCLMVYGPGRYRFTDFVRVGSGLTLAIALIALALVPRLWPVEGP